MRNSSKKIYVATVIIYMLASLFSAVSPRLTWAYPGDINTIAGGGGGPTDSALHSTLLSPRAVAIDETGNIYIPDRDAHQIRKVTPDGRISTIAGNGTPGFCGDTGNATEACLDSPRGVAVDGKGNIFIADSNNNRIRKVDPGGIITTITGNGISSYSGDGYQAVDATINYPNGLAVDSNNNVYIADSGNNCIRMINSDGIISTIAGNGNIAGGYGGDNAPAIAALLASPYGVSITPAGNILIADYGNNRIRAIDGAGYISTVAGNGNTGFEGDGVLATTTSIDGPYSAVMDSNGSIYISDTFNRRIRKVSENGIISTIAGTGISGFNGDERPATTSLLDAPRGMAISLDGTLIFADNFNHRVRSVTPNGIIHTLAGSGIAGFGGDNGPAVYANIDSPLAATSDTSGNVYIADTYNSRIRLIDSKGFITTIAGMDVAGFSGDGGEATHALLDSPADIARDSAGNIYISDSANHRIRKILISSGFISTIAGDGTPGFSGDNGPAVTAKLNQPRGIAIDINDNLYVADSGNHRVRKISTNGIISTFAGTGTGGYNGDELPAISAHLNSPRDVSINSAGTVFVADTDNNRIRAVAQNGIISTVAGVGIYAYLGDGGPAVDACLAAPSSISFDSDGNMYIADTANHAIRKIIANGFIITLAGNGGANFSGDGNPAYSATLNSPHGIATDKSGNVFIADTENHRIRVVEQFNVPNASITINDGAALTPVGTVTLNLACIDMFDNSCPYMRISTDAVMDSETWNIFNNTSQITLPSGNGIKTVYAEFMDAYGNKATTSAAIELQQTPPTGGLSINNNASITFQQTVTLALSCLDSSRTSCSHMRFSTTGDFTDTPWSEFASTFQYKLADGYGAKNISVEFMDRDGLISPVYTASIEFNQPIVTLSSKPDAISSGPSSFVFSAPNVTTYECRLDAEDSFRPCTSPYYKMIPGGSHLFEVRATDPSGNPSLTTSYSWTIIASLAGAGYSWGGNQSGQLGIGSAETTNHPLIEKIPAPVGMVQIASRNRRSIGLRNDGTVWVWGSAMTVNSWTAEYTSPVQVPTAVGGFEDIVAVAAGTTFNLALKSDGTVWSWGYSYYGELGYPGFSNLVPSQIPGLSGVTAISAGNFTATALKNDGSVVAWGSNDFGLLGIGSSDSSPHTTPVQVTNLSNVTKIISCKEHTLALDGDGAVWSWGNTFFNRLGRSGSGNIPGRVTASGLGPVTSIACGDEFSLAVSNGYVWSWGANYLGQLGNGTVDGNNTNAPSSTGILTNGIISAGANHALAVSTSNTLYAWGANNFGQLGLGIYDSKAHPTPETVAYLSGVSGIAAGADFSMALTRNWVTDTVVSAGGSTVFSPRLAVDTAGKSHILWRKGDGSFNYSTNSNGSWIHENLGINIGTLSALLIDSKGVLHSTYLKGLSMVHRFKNPDNSWSEETVVTLPALNTIGGGSLVEDSASNLHLCYTVQNTFYYVSRTEVGWAIPVVLDPSAGAGTYGCSLAASENGDIHAVYYRDDGLVYTKLTGLPAAWTPPTTLVPNQYQGGVRSPSIRTSGTGGQVLNITYQENLSRVNNMERTRLKFLTNRSQSAGSETGPWVDVIVDNYENLTGQNPSLDVREGKIGIAYYDKTNGDLKFALADDQSGPTNFVLTTIDFAGDVGSYSSLKFDPFGVTHIAYIDETKQSVKYASDADFSKPSGSISISGNGNLTYTTSPTTVLHLSCSDGSGSGCWQMRLSTDGSNWSPFENIASTKPYTLASGDGQKTLYVKYRDAANNWSPETSATIFLDTVKPTGGLTITSSNGFTKDRLVLLNTACDEITSSTTSGCDRMKFSTDGSTYQTPLPYTTESSIFLPAGDGLKPVYGIYTDKAGNDSITYSASVTLDQTPPTTTPSQLSGEKTTAISVSLGCDDGSGSGCASIYYTLDGSVPTVLSTRYTGPIAISGLTSQVVLKYFSVDNLGNQESYKTETYDFASGYTTLTLDIQPTLQQGELLDVAGKLTRYPDSQGTPNNGMGLSGLPIKLTITGPADSPCKDGCFEYTTTYSTLGHYRFSNLDRFAFKGSYILKADFLGTGLHQPSHSSNQSILVGASAGYAIIVQGKVNNDAGLDSHNKTTNRIYETLKERGFVDDNIMYFNYAGIMAAGVDAVPVVGTAGTENTIQWAVETWAKARMNGSPAPLYVIFVDHGNNDTFYIDPDTISSTDLNTWLTSLEGGLNTAAKREKRIIILGACYSGSFLENLKQAPTPNTNAGRIVISSAAANEQSYKGPNEPDGVRGGEFFIEELFKQLKKGFSIKAAFVEAAALTRTFTSQGSESANSVNNYNDTAVQHPLLEDDGTGSGSNTIVDGTGDGVESAALHLGFGVTNAALGPADLKAVTPTHYLPYDQDSTPTPIWLEPYGNSAVSSAWFEMKAPSKTLLAGSGSNQLALDLPTGQMTIKVSGKWEPADGEAPLFASSGKYEIYYFTKSTNAEVSEMKRSLVYRNKLNNQKPNTFNLVSPGAGGVEEQTRTELNFVWDATSDPDTNSLTYTLQIATDATFSVMAYQREEIGENWLALDKGAGLKDRTSYYWRVQAVDQYGEIRTSSQVWRFKTDDTNSLPAQIIGTVVDGLDKPVPGAVVAAVLSGSGVKAQASAASGAYAMLPAEGTYIITVTAPGFQPTQTDPFSVSSGSVYNVPKITLNADQATLRVSVNGPGRVYQNPNAAIDCTSSDNTAAGCHTTAANGTPFSLIATSTDWRYLFGSWGGISCDGGSNTATICSFTLNASANITATFGPNYQAKISTETPYASLQEALDNAAPDTTVRARDYVFQEPILFDRLNDALVYLEGGLASDYVTPAGRSTVRGSFRVKRGTLKIKGPVDVK